MRSWIRALGAVSAVVLAACIFACGGGGGPTPSAPSATQPVSDAEELRSGSRAAGVQFAKTVLEGRLRSPSSAEYPWDFVQSRVVCDTDEYFGCVVTGVVDAQNAFGAVVREPWEVVAVLDRSRDQWAPIFVSLSGDPVFGSQRAVDELLAMDGGEPTGLAAPPPEEVEDPEPPAPDFRTWTDTSGEFTVEAEFVRLSMGTVTLRKADGSEISLSMEKLSEDDQAWVRDQF